MDIHTQLRCRQCGTVFPGLMDDEKTKAYNDGYAITIYCPNPECENHHGGLFSKPDK